MTQKKRQGIAIDFASKAGMGPEGFEFGSKDESISLPTVIKGLFTHAVAREEENTVIPVPERNGKHAGAFLDG